MAGRPRDFWSFGRKIDRMAGGGLRSGRSVLKSREESNGVTVMEWIFPKSRKPIFRGCHFFWPETVEVQKLWFRQEILRFRPKSWPDEELWGEVEAFGTDFFRGIRFSRSQGPKQPKTGKSKNPGFRISDFFGRPAGRPAFYNTLNLGLNLYSNITIPITIPIT